MSNQSSSREVNTPLSFALKNIDFTHPTRKLLGIDSAALDTHEVGYYSGRGHFKDSLVAPIYDAEHALIGYFQINTDVPDMPLIKYPTPEHFSLHADLYNEHRVVSLENRSPMLGITRSPLKVIELTAQGHVDAIAFFGDVPSPAQCARIENLLDTYHYEGLMYYTSHEDKAEHVGYTVQLIRSPQWWCFK